LIRYDLKLIDIRKSGKIEKVTLYKRFWRLALLTSPFIASLGVIPMLFFLTSLPEEFRLHHQANAPNFIVAYSTVSGVIFIIWAVNINLYRFFKKWNKRIISRAVDRYVFSFVLSFGVLITFYLLTNGFRPDFKNGYIKYYPFMVVFTSNVIILIFMNLLISQSEKASLLKEKAQLELATLEAQHEQLKQQLHPHFLFNALTNLRWLIKQNQENAVEYSDLLSSFLRSSMNISKHDAITLEEDLNFMNDYIALQKVRFKDSLKVEIRISESLTSRFSLPVMSLQLLAENAIKHNGMTKGNPLQITLNIEGDVLEFSNNKILKDDPFRIGEGIGLKNLNERCKLISGRGIEITDNDEEFSVKLKLVQ